MHSGNLHLASTPPRFAVRVRAVLAARCKQTSSGLPGRSLAERPKLLYHSFASLRKLAPVFSNTYELFCTLQNVNSHAFNQFRTLSQKHRGGGTPFRWLKSTTGGGSQPAVSGSGIAEFRYPRSIFFLLKGFRMVSESQALAPRVPFTSVAVTARCPMRKLTMMWTAVLVLAGFGFV